MTTDRRAFLRGMLSVASAIAAAGMAAVRESNRIVDQSRRVDESAERARESTLGTFRYEGGFLYVFNDSDEALTFSTERLEPNPLPYCELDLYPDEESES